jgi:hypothetical protein
MRVRDMAHSRLGLLGALWRSSAGTVDCMIWAVSSRDGCKFIVFSSGSFVGLDLTATGVSERQRVSALRQKLDVEIQQ